MGGLQRLLLRITPVVMLICFICFGITHAFQQTGQQNLTYMTETYFDKETFTEIQNPTAQQKETALKVYEFDARSYVDNIDINILKRAVTNSIDTDTYKQTIDKFNALWENGYQIGDVVKTILNALLLTANTIIIIINIIILPVRVIAGILLTAFSLVGINISRETPIITSLNAILDNLAIPQIQPTAEKDTPDTNVLSNTIWQFDNPRDYEDGGRTINVKFMISNDQTIYDSLTITKNGQNSTTITATYMENDIPVTTYFYRNQQWQIQNYDYKITIINQQLTDQQINDIISSLVIYMTNVTNV